MPAVARSLIHDISTNSSAYPGNRIPRYEKFEITFQVDTDAANLQLPFDPAPPPGLSPGMGVSIDASFTPDHWATVYTQPAFFYQGFDDQVKGGREWFYPNGKNSWKVRFSPDQPGDWQYKLTARDSGGVSETAPASFSVIASAEKGFLRVSRKDSRYFEFDDGTYFPGLSVNLPYDHIHWDNPVLDNQANFQSLSANGIQMVRMWLSQWGIYGSAWNPWNSIDPDLHAQLIPYTGITLDEAYPGSDASMELDAQVNPCMFLGFMKAPPAVKPNTRYHVRIRYKTSGLAGPRAAGQPYGLAAKTGDWLWGDGKNCYDPGTGSRVTPHQPQDSRGWEILEGSLRTGSVDFLPNFYLVLENAQAGKAFIDYVWIEEDLGKGQYGPNIVSKPWMAHHLYMDQRASYAFDKTLELAAQTGLYLRPVILEKNEYILDHIDYQGKAIADDPKCAVKEPKNAPAECPGNRWFYGDGRSMTKTRWLEGAWWRYLQARWGYSPHIHSWELLNEGDPWDGLHYTLADEFGKYMRQFRPDNHLVSTSFWHSYPRDEFWANPNYANIDFVDVHQYIGEEDPGAIDTAQATVDASLAYGARQPGGAGKPVIRGETSFINLATWQPTARFQKDPSGIWLHNFIWGGINSGGLIESYWYTEPHIVDREKSDRSYMLDLRPIFRAYYNFIRPLPLNNGSYRDARAQASNPGLRILGQVDPRSGWAHLWIQNRGHTWKNVAEQVNIPPISDQITLDGFQPGMEYTLAWFDPYQPDPGKQLTRAERTAAGADGRLRFNVSNLAADIALRITPAGASAAPDR